MKRVKLINDPAELISLFRAIDTPARRAVLTTLAEGWTPLSQLMEAHGEEALDTIHYYEKFKLVESRWEVTDVRPEKAYRTFYNGFQISTSLTFDDARELLTVVLMSEEDFLEREARILELIGSKGLFTGDVAKEMELTPLQLKGLVRRSTKADFKGHYIIPLGEQ